MTLTEAANIASKMLQDRFVSINIEITKNGTLGVTKPRWRIYADELGSAEGFTFEETIDQLRIISNTADRTKDVILK